MKTLYLHIGTSKTGTTAIQYFCSENQAVLNRHGYIYPEFSYRYKRVGKYRNARFLLGSVFNEDRKRDREAKDRRVEECFGIINDAFKTYDNVIISDEALWNDALEKGVYDKVKAEADKGNFQLKIVVYLRLQDEYLQSWWNQRLKTGLRPQSRMTWEEVTEKLPFIKLDYYNMLEQIAKRVGKKNIIVRRFDKKCFAGGSIYADFLQAVGLSYTDEYQIGMEERNLRLTYNATEIKRILNCIPGLDNERNRKFREVLLEQSQNRKEDSNLNMFSEEEVIAFRKKYEEGNNRVAREYMGIQEPLFEYGNTQRKKWNPEETYMVEDVILFFGTMLVQQDNELRRVEEELKNELKKQKEYIKHVHDLIRHPVKSIQQKLSKDKE